jgi:hypothetical protein
MGSRPRVHLQHYLSPGLPAIAGANAEHGVLSGAWYPPHNRLVVPGPWRTLEVIVSSNHAKVFWEGGALGEVDQSDCAPGFQQWANRFPDLRGPLVNQAPRGSLGIYVFGGAASVRRLQIDPLPKP